MKESKSGKMKKLDQCPSCGFDNLGDQWCTERKLQQYCLADDCDWEGEPRTPEQKEIKTTATYTRAGCPVPYSYTLYDRFGHVLIYSAGFSSEEECEDELFSELMRYRSDKVTGPCTGVIFPPRVKVEGKVYK